MVKRCNIAPTKNNMISLPGDVKGLIDNGYLRMNLLDFILHSTCTYSSDTSDINYCLGGTVTRQWLEHMLMLIRGLNKQEKFEKLCKQLEQFGEGRLQIIVPDIDKSHFSVIDIIIDNKTPNYITKVPYYDSHVAKNEISNHEKCPSTNQGLHSQFHKSFQQVCSRDK